MIPKNIERRINAMKKKILSLLMCTVMVFAFAMPIGAEGDVEPYVLVTRCPDCGENCYTRTKTYSVTERRNCNTYNSGYDICEVTYNTSYIDCSKCTFTIEGPTTVLSVTVTECHGYNYNGK